MPLFFLFSFCITSCAQSQAQSDFYLGLLAKHDTAEAVRHFEKALSSSNIYIRQAAAEELANFIYDGRELSRNTNRKVRQEISGAWKAAYEAVEAKDRQKVLDFLFDFDQSNQNSSARVINEAKLYVIQESEKQGVFLSEAELAAVEGNFAVSSLMYNEALVFFRAFMQDEVWTEEIPPLFLQYPVLITSLGRAFQYTSSGAEGLSLFLRWEKALSGKMTDNAGAVEEARYRLLFYSARIARRIGQASQAISLFEQALPLAPDAEQSDACIWYILDSSFRDTAAFIEKLEQYVQSWSSPGYFDDILERFLHTLTAGKNWEKIINVFDIIQNLDGAFSKAGYAWTIGRLVEEGFLSNQEIILAAKVSGVIFMAPYTYFQIAYNASENDTRSFLYYRHLSASALDKPLLEFPAVAEEPRKGRANNRNRNRNVSDALQFLLGFFEHNASGYAMPYIRQIEDDLSVEELRAAARALADAEMYIQSIQLVYRYTAREDYIRDRRDFELLFPIPFADLVEMHAAKTGITPEMLFALIRTESAFQSGVVSRAGAVGLTQLLPATAVEMAVRIRRESGVDYTAAEGGLDLKDPSVNIHIGAYYLNYLKGRFNDDTLLSLLAYNGGMNRIRRWRAASALPVDLFLETITLPETRDYGRKVMADAAVYKFLYYSGN